jgi:hypothetical protein
LICNRQSEKAKRYLLLPPIPQNKAQRSQTLKHNPLEEFQASPYIERDSKAPTYLHLPSGAFKKCIAQAAIDIPGASKAQVGRLVSMTKTVVYVWGKPFMKADMVPDVRFRACLPRWATKITYTYLPAIISPNSLSNLLYAAGTICGVGDYRVEKGAGDWGQFDIVGPDDAEWNDIVNNEGRKVQQAAMQHPQYMDDDTRDLVEWFDEEIERRRRAPSMSVVGKAKPAKRSKKSKVTELDLTDEALGSADGFDEQAGV